MTGTPADASPQEGHEGLDAWLRSRLAALDDAGLCRARRVTVGLPDGWCEQDGRRLRNFASNDYLGLTQHPEVRAAIREVADEAAGAGASALITGRSPWHERLERGLAEFEGTEAALLFPSGYAANVGTIAALTERGDTIFSDRRNHASLIDGCRLSRATVRVYRHDRLPDLSRDLASATASGRRLLVTDGVFSMDGTVAPLAELTILAERHGCDLLVDEAHGTGVLGDRGRGACEAAGLQARATVRTGTLSKAVGCSGGFVAGSAELIEWLWNRARTQFFSTALPPAVCAASLAALRIISTDAARRERLRDRVHELRLGLKLLGCDTGSEGAAAELSVIPIVPLMTGESAAAVALSTSLADAGFLVPAIRPPTVPDGRARLRISVSAAHPPEAVSDLLAALDRCLPQNLRRLQP